MTAAIVLAGGWLLVALTRAQPDPPLGDAAVLPRPARLRPRLPWCRCGWYHDTLTAPCPRAVLR